MTLNSGTTQTTWFVFLFAVAAVAVDAFAKAVGAAVVGASPALAAGFVVVVAAASAA